MNPTIAKSQTKRTVVLLVMLVALLWAVALPSEALAEGRETVVAPGEGTTTVLIPPGCTFSLGGCNAEGVCELKITCSEDPSNGNGVGTANKNKGTGQQ
jgi:hypothetical protein